jgi:activator of HSP90 ATPase
MADDNELDIPGTWATRRHIIAHIVTGIAAAAGGLALRSVDVEAAASEKISRTNESIHQEVVFKAARKRVFDALVDGQQFQKVVQLSAAGMSLGNAPIEISRDEGGKFSLFGGHILGRQIELVSNERIVQAWRVADWDPGVYSIAKFQLADQGPDTKLALDHTGFPTGQARHLADGWNSNYWEPLAKYLK